MQHQYPFKHTLQVYGYFIGFNNHYHNLKFFISKEFSHLLNNPAKEGLIIPILHIEKLIFKGGGCLDQGHKTAFM